MPDLGLPPRPALQGTWFWWCAFVVYGSLMPFEWRSVPLEQALAQFAHLPWLALGLGSRLDWLANVFLYLPVGLLGTIALQGPSAATSRRALAAFCAALVGGALALSIEFTQIFFAPRTVSLNDVVAECLGTAIGIVLALFGGAAFSRLVAQASSPGSLRRGALLKLYGLAYFALCFFPFDFSTASEVLQAKLAEGHAGWWIAPVNGAHPARAGLQLAVEALLTLPFGIALARRGPQTLRSPVAATALGLVVGVLIETVQLVLLSATSQGASAVSRAIGLGLGAVLARHEAEVHAWWTPTRRRALVVASVLPWLAVLAGLAGWRAGTVETSGWLQRAAEVHWLPLYYHYYVGESRALTSLLQCVASYAGVGVAVALWTPQPQPRLAAALAGLAAVTIEGSRLALVGHHPDPSNVLIGGFAAWAAHRLIHRWRGTVEAPPAAVNVRPPSDRPALAFTLAVAGAIVIAARAAPGAPAALSLVGLAFAVATWREPASALLLLPVVIGLTDVAAESGPRWVDAVDVALITMTVLALVRPGTSTTGERPAWPASAWWLLGLLPAAVVGVEGWVPGDPSALLTPLGSGWGAAQAKSLLWLGGLLLFMQRMRLDPELAARMLGRGMTVSLAGVVTLTLAERLAFVGPFDFSSDYRAPGPFSAISLGGAYIECFLAASVPFAVAAALHERLRLARWAAALVVLAAAYATMVTFSRGGQVVFLAVVLAGVLLPLSGRTRHGMSSGSRWVRGAALVAAVSVVAASVLLAPYALERFQHLGEDAQTRFDHWHEGMGFGRSGAKALAWGNGLGSFGRDSYVDGDPRLRPGVFVLHREAGNTWLTAHPGSLSYLDQRVDVEHGEPLRLSARLRSGSIDGGVQAIVCEKDLVQSRACGVAKLRVPGDGQWHLAEAEVTLPPNAEAGWPARPVRFTLMSGSSAAVDIDDLRVTDREGRSRLRNGDFEQGAAHWWYGSDRHLTWHMKNLWLQVLYEQGLLGVLAHVALLIAGVAGAWRASRRSPYGLALALSLLAFQGVGLIDSVIDAPRFALLYLSLALLGAHFGSREQRGHAPRSRESAPAVRSSHAPTAPLVGHASYIARPRQIADDQA